MTLPTPVRLSTLPVGARFAMTPRQHEAAEFYTKLDARRVRRSDGVEFPSYGDPAVWPAPDTTEAA